MRKQVVYSKRVRIKDNGEKNMDGIIFDVDGTLWDSTDEVAISWNQAIKEQTDIERILTGAELKKEFGKPLEEIMKDLFPDLSVLEREELAEHLYRYENKWVETAPCHVYEGSIDTIKELSKDYKLFIVSNCQSGYIEAYLKNTGLGEYFTDFTCPGDTGKLKGENIRIIMERNDLKDVVYVGDTQGDANACKEAGVPMIFAKYGFGEVENPEMVIETFAELQKGTGLF